MKQLTFYKSVTPRPKPGLLDVVTTLRHFALVTYTVDPEMLKRSLPPRLTPVTIDVDGASRALLSVVLFKNSNFRSAVFPSPAFNMAQINYRAYVIDDSTGDHAIWFVGTLLDGWPYVVPRLLWQMPWRKGAIHIRCQYDAVARRYESYAVTSTSRWAPAQLELVQEQSGEPPTVQLPGFPDAETGLVYLTHATKGFFRRKDGRIGLNQVWHERMSVAPAQLKHASFPLLDRLELVPASKQMAPYSVLLSPATDFMSMLPPKVVSEQ